jgi:FkbM family methyltransferase
MNRLAYRLCDYFRIGGIKIAIPLLRSAIVGADPIAKILRPGIRFPFYLRVRTSDYHCYKQIFDGQEYAFQVSRQPRTIIDAGANIGLASIYFANKFPNARIISIEPEISNYELLERNTAAYDKITPVLGALWNEESELHLVDPGNGKWGYIAQQSDGRGEHLGKMHQQGRGITMDSLLEDFGIERVDVLKVDIEGSEREVFRGRPAWVGKVDALIIEIHDWLKPGCSDSVYAATDDFDNEWQQGENVYMTRSNACILRQNDN